MAVLVLFLKSLSLYFLIYSFQIISPYVKMKIFIDACITYIVFIYIMRFIFNSMNA